MRKIPSIRRKCKLYEDIQWISVKTQSIRIKDIAQQTGLKIDVAVQTTDDRHRLHNVLLDGRPPEN